MSRSLCFGAFAIFVNFIPFCSKNGNFMQKMKNEWRRTYEMEKMKQTTTTNKKKKCPFSTIQTCCIQCSYHTNHIILYTKKKETQNTCIHMKVYVYTLHMLLVCSAHELILTIWLLKQQQLEKFHIARCIRKLEQILHIHTCHTNAIRFVCTLLLIH